MQHPTKRQQQVLDVIRGYVGRNGFGPSMQEIAEALKLPHAASVRGHLVALVKKGLVTMKDHTPRSIRPVEAGGRGLQLAGRVSAGGTMEGFEQHERMDLAEMFPEGKCFALEVQGDSMIEDGIRPGDFVIVRRQRVAADGDRVIAMVRDEVTLKVFRRKGRTVILQPCNKAMKPIVCRDSEVHIQGIVVGVIRKY